MLLPKFTAFTTSPSSAVLPLVFSLRCRVDEFVVEFCPGCFREKLPSAPVGGVFLLESPLAKEVDSLPPALRGATLSCKFSSSIFSGAGADASMGTYWSTIKTLTVPSGSNNLGNSPGFHSNPKPFSMHSFPNDNTLHGLLFKIAASTVESMPWTCTDNCSSAVVIPLAVAILQGL